MVVKYQFDFKWGTSSDTKYHRFIFTMAESMVSGKSVAWEGKVGIHVYWLSFTKKNQSFIFFNFLTLKLKNLKVTLKLPPTNKVDPWHHQICHVSFPQPTSDL